jgi:hypothetical protein
MQRAWNLQARDVQLDQSRVADHFREPTVPGLGTQRQERKLEETLVGQASAVLNIV